MPGVKGTRHMDKPTNASSECQHEWLSSHIDGCHWYVWSRDCTKCGVHEESYHERKFIGSDAAMADPRCPDCKRLMSGSAEGMHGAKATERTLRFIPEQARRRVLLRKWAELEPERCRFSPRIPGGAELHFGEGGPWYPLAGFELFWVVVDAIESREWYWMVTGNPKPDLSRPRYAGYVKRKDSEVSTRDYYSESPTDALLEAYLGALEGKHAFTPSP